MTLFRQRYRIETSRLQDWDYAAPGWYFVTICTHGHRCWFGRVMPSSVELSPLGQIAVDQWVAIPSHYDRVKLDEFVVMPNHLHGIIVIEGRHQFSPGSADVSYVSAGFESPRKGSLSAIVRAYKSGVSRLASQNAFLDFAWQPRFYDRVLRDARELIAAREYIGRNPAKWFEDKYFATPEMET